MASVGKDVKVNRLEHSWKMLWDFLACLRGRANYKETSKSQAAMSE